MTDKERNNQTGAEDPFSVFGELASLDSEIERNSTLLASKVRELKFNVTMRKGQKTKLVLSTTDRDLLSDIKKVYKNKAHLQEKGENLIEALQRSHDE